MYGNFFFRRPLINVERSILDMLKHRRISTNEIEKYENEFMETQLQMETKSPNLNYKLWKQKMAEKEEMYSVPFSKYKRYEHKLDSMKDNKILEEKMYEEEIKPTQHLTPIKKNNKTEMDLSKTAMSILGLHLICGLSWYYMTKHQLPDITPESTDDSQ
eukprot:112107_1